MSASNNESLVPPNIPKGMMVLDVGCGTGQLLIDRYGDQRSFGIDEDFQSVKGCEKPDGQSRIRLLQG